MEIRWHHWASKEIDNLKKDLANRILDKIEETAKDPQHFLEGLTGTKFHKIRVGIYRVIIKWDRKNDILSIIMIDTRDRIYKRLHRLL